MSSGKGGAHEAGFRTRPERTAGKIGKTDREATPKRHRQNNDDDHDDDDDGDDDDDDDDDDDVR